VPPDFFWTGNGGRSSATSGSHRTPGSRSSPLPNAPCHARRAIGNASGYPTISEMSREFFLVGPTAVGKSSLAVDVAEELGAEIVNADAFQIYRGLDILTAKPDLATQRRVPHHLLSAVGWSEEMSAAKFREVAMAPLDDIRARGKIAIVVSGSGLYVSALAHGFDVAAPPNPTLRAELSALSPEELARRLGQLDPQLAARTDLKNPRRLIRTIEVAESNARGEKVVIPSPATRDREKRNPDGIFLTRDRGDLYRRIDERVLAMFREGVEREVAALDKIGPTAAQALGLREVQQLLTGKISRDDCIAKIQQATRRYAKRQLTWFRHQTNFPLLNLTALSHREAVGAITRAIAR
jgi:tRNA dimethylallyltransferase